MNNAKYTPELVAEAVPLVLALKRDVASWTSYSRPLSRSNISSDRKLTRSGPRHGRRGHRRAQTRTRTPDLDTSSCP